IRAAARRARWLNVERMAGHPQSRKGPCRTAAAQARPAGCPEPQAARRATARTPMASGPRTHSTDRVIAGGGRSRADSAWPSPYSAAARRGRSTTSPSPSSTNPPALRSPPPPSCGAAWPLASFPLTVVDKSTGVPIPNIRLETTNAIEFQSDAVGRIDVYEPGIMGTTVFFAFDTCVNSWAPGTKWCDHDRSTVCTTDAECNQGHEPVRLPFFGSWITGTQLTPVERGMVQVRLCPAGTAPVQCVSDVVKVGSAVANAAPAAAQLFAIRVVDAQTGRGVPLVEGRSPSRTFVTDSAGVVAYDEEGAMGSTVPFAVSSHGYTPTTVNLVVTPGG